MPTETRGMMLHSGDPHKCHVGFANAAGLDLHHIPPYFDNWLQATVVDSVARGAAANIPDGDLFVIEHGDVLFTVPKIRRIHPNATILYLFAQGELFRDRYDFARSHPVKRAVRRGNTTLTYYLSRAVIRQWIDGLLVNSEFMKKRTRDLISSTIPIRITEPYIDDKRYYSLFSCDPTLSGQTVVTVGRAEQTKGTDLLIDAWPYVRENFPEATLKIAGDGHLSYDTPGVEGLGFVSDIESLFEASALYVHPSRVEAFGVAVVEAMRAGLPTVVTNTSGAKSVVQKVDESFIVSPSPDAISTRIIQYLESELRARQQLSKQFRDASTPFDRSIKSEQFVSAVAQLQSR